MIGIFKQKNPGNTLVLFVYALILKFPAFLRPQPALRQNEDHYLYNWLINFLEPLRLAPILYALLAFIFLLIQASLLNRIFNNAKMLPRPTFLPAMSYILITSLLPEWNQFSSPLLINTLLILFFYRTTLLYNTPKPSYAVFNLGLLMGLVTMLYKPAIVFVLLIPLTLFIMRPFRIREWLIGLFGVTIPYYFLGVILFLSDSFRWNRIIPTLEFNLPAIPDSIYVTLAITLMVVPFIVGGFFVQDNLNKMLIQVRKTWSVTLIILIVSMLIIIVNGGSEYANWILCAFPLAAFHASAYFYPQSRTFPLVLHWLGFAYALYVNYVAFSHL